MVSKNLVTGFLVKLFPLKNYWFKNTNNLKLPQTKGPQNIPFLLKLLRCIVIISQSFTIKLKWPIETNSSETDLPPLVKTEVVLDCWNIHFVFWAFWADFVTLPVPAAFFSTALMTPTATVCLMSRTAKRPRKEKVIFLIACFDRLLGSPTSKKSWRLEGSSKFLPEIFFSQRHKTSFEPNHMNKNRQTVEF